MTRAPILICVAALLFASSARAEGASVEDRAAADALYSQAGELLKANRFAEACPKLETSQRLDPGIGTLIRLGYCYENLGRTASGWSAYLDAEALARRMSDKRADDAAARAKAIEPKLSRLFIVLKSRGPGLQILRDGKPVDPGLWGSTVPVDPGEYVIEASMPGKQTWKTTVRVAPGPGITEVRVPEFASTADSATEAKPPGGTWWGTQRIAGVVVAGGGALAAVAGAVLGGVTLANASSLRNGGHCNADLTACDAIGLPLRQDAKTLANGSTGALVAGGVLLATGVVVFATGSPDGASAAAKTGARFVVGPVAGPGMTGVLVVGRW